MATQSRKLLAANLLAFTLSISIAAVTVVTASIPVGAANQQAALLNNDGVKALNSGNFQLAIQKFEEALKIEPGYTFARDNLAIAYNNYALKLPPAQALKFFHKALAISPSNTTTGQNLDAVVQSLGKDPRSFKDRVELGKQCRTSADFDGAIVEYQAALRIQNNGKLHAELGDVLRVRDRVDDAVNEYKAALAAGGLEGTEMAKVNVKLGQAYQAKKDLPHAIAAFGDAIKFRSDDPEVLDALITGWEEALRENPQAPENHIGLGQAYQYKGDFGLAEAEYKQAMVFDKNNAIARQLLAGLGEAKRKAEIAKHINNGVDLQTNKNYDGAIGEYMVAFKLDPSNPDIMLNIGSVCQAKEDWDRAIAAYQRVLSMQPGNKAATQGMKICQDAKAAKAFDDLNKSAGDAYKAGRYQEALTKYQQVLRQTPNDAGLHFNVAAAYQQLNQLDQAIVEYKQAVSLDAKNEEYKKYLETALDKKAQPIIDQAVAAHKAKKYQEAINLYQQAIGLRPKNVELYYDVASAQYSLQNYDQARQQYMKALELDPKGQVKDLFLLGTIDEHYGKGYDAMDKYRKYLAAAPGGDFAKAAKERLDTLAKNPQDTQKIKSEAELATIKDATDAYQQAVKLQGDKRYDEALPLMQKAMNLMPKESAYVYGMGALYYAKGDMDKASTFIDQALAMDPKNKDFQKVKDQINGQRAEKMVNDAVAKQTAEDFRGAITLYQQALTLVPKNARVHTNLASAYYAADDFQNAYNEFKKAIELDINGEKLNFYSLAAIDENYNRGAVALDEYRKFVTMNPGDKLVAAAQERIKALTANIAACKPLPTREQVKVGQAAGAAYDEAVKAQEAKDYDKALQLYIKASNLNPKEGAYQFAIGSIYQAKGDAVKAAEFYAKAVQLSPDNAEFKKYLQAMKVGQAAPLVDEAAKKYTAGDLKGAIGLYRQALSIVNDAAVHTDLASCLQGTDDFAGALKEYEEAFKLDPKTQAEDLYFIGALKEHFSRGSEALQTYRDYVTKNPSGKFKQYANDRMAVLSKDVTAVQHLQTTTERQTAQAAQTDFDDAVKLQQAGKYDEAEAKYASLMQRYPKEGAYPYARGTNFQAKGDIAKALEMYDRALALDPKNAEYKKLATGIREGMAAQIIDQGSQKFAAKDYAGAIETWKQALMSAPKNLQANLHTNIGMAYQYSDQWAAARDEYKKGFDADNKTEVDNLYFMGPLDETLGRGAQAFEDYKQYLQYAGQPKGKYYNQAMEGYQRLYNDKTKLNRMQTQAQQAAAQAGSDLFNEAVQLQTAGKLDEAIAKYQEALKSTPNVDNIWYSLGTAYQGKSDNDKAMEAYQKAMSLNPKEANYKKVFNDLKNAVNAAKAGPLMESAYKKQTATPPDLPGAIADYEAALRLTPEDANLWYCAGTAYQANKQIPKAEIDYLKATQLDPKLADPYYFIGALWESQNKKAEAKQMYMKYVQLKPAGDYAADAKERIKNLK